jgi:hypothetical protein
MIHLPTDDTSSNVRLRQDELNFALCRRSELYSTHDLDIRYCSETREEFELLILKDLPSHRRWWLYF